MDKIGVSFTDKSVATGFGSYIAQPMMRKAMEGFMMIKLFECLDEIFTNYAENYEL